MRLQSLLAPRPPVAAWRARVGCALLAAAGVLAGLPARAASDGTPIARVRVEGTERVDEEAVLTGIALTAGTPFAQAKVADDIRRVWRTGFFQDVRLEEESGPAGELILVWQVVEKPTVRRVVIEGRDKVSEEDIRGVLNIKVNTLYDEQACRANVAKVRDLYLGKGYTLVEVSHLARPAAGARNQVEVAIVVAENARVVVRQISFSGQKFFTAAQLKDAMRTREGNELSFFSSAGSFREDALEEDVLRLQSLYADEGFVNVKVAAPRATMSADRRNIFIAIDVDEGERFRVGPLSAHGEVDLAAEGTFAALDQAALVAAMHLTEGEIFSRRRLFEDVQALTELYRDRGYAYANVSPNARVDPAAKTVSIDLEVERGEVVTIERIDIRGNTKTRDKVIRRELTIVEGDRFQGGAQEQSRARVFQLGYFETVQVTGSSGSRPDLMKVTVEVKEKATGTFQVGAGLNSAEGLIANAQISQENFLGHGQSVGLSMHLSFGRYAQRIAQVRFFEPRFLDSRWALGMSTYWHKRRYRDFERNARGFAPTFGLSLARPVRLTGGYTLEWVDIGQPGGRNQVVLSQYEREGRVSSVNLTLSFDTRNNRLFPTRGVYDEVRLDVSSPWLGAERPMAFKKLETICRGYLPLWRNSVVLKANLQLGWAFGAEGGVPISERYFPGGITSVRGFPPLSLGPSEHIPASIEAPLGRSREMVVGGNKQVVFNLELEWPLIPKANLRGVVFGDAGNAFAEQQALFYAGTPLALRDPGWMRGSNRQVTPPLGLFWSVGVGVRFALPIGLLRFEWGFPIVKHAPDDPNSMFEFTIGNFF